jgi:8-oxo-dGTP pyrophosphatase MutT (NUDIX family)
MPLETLIARLTSALGATSPAGAIQQRLSPRLRDGSTIPRAPGEAQAAALLLVFARGHVPHVVLTLRASHLAYHADQVSLPGGRMEPDETPEAAALREAHEEIGVSPSTVHIVGRLTPVFIPVSGFTLHVVVGITNEPPAFRLDPGEVAQVLEVPLDDLMNPERLKRGLWIREGRELDVPYFEVGELKVWGATAMALGEFLSLCGYDADPWGPDPLDPEALDH